MTEKKEWFDLTSQLRSTSKIKKFTQGNIKNSVAYVPFLILQILFFALAFFQVIESKLAFILSLSFTGLLLVVLVINNKEGEELQEILSEVIVCYLFVNFFSLIYSINIYPFLESEYDQTKYKIIFSMTAIMIVGLLYFSKGRVLSEIKNDIELIENKPRAKQLIMIGTITWVLYFIILAILFKVLEDKTVLFYILVVGFVGIWAIIGIPSVKRIPFDEFKQIHIATMVVVGLFIMPLFVIFGMFPIMESFSEMQGMVAEGGIFVGGINYFDEVFFLLLQSPAPSITIAYMMVSTLAIIVASNLGLMGRFIAGISVSTMVIIPFIIVMAQFTGVIPPPDHLVDLGIGSRVASVIYGFAQLSAMTLVWGLILTIIILNRMLGDAVAGNIRDIVGAE